MPDFRSAVKLNSIPMTGVIGSGASVNLYTGTTGSLASFTTEADIPSSSISVVVPGSSATVLAVVTFAFQTAAAAVTMSGFFNWNGSDRNGNATITSDSSTTCVYPSAQSWVITGVSAGTYTAKLRASCSASASGNKIVNLASVITIMVLGNS